MTQVTTHFEKGKFYFRIFLLSSQIIPPRFIWIGDQSDSGSDDDWSCKVWAVIGLSPKWRHSCLWLCRGDPGGEIFEQVKNGDWLNMRQFLIVLNCRDHLERGFWAGCLQYILREVIHKITNDKKWWQIFHCVDWQHTWLLMPEYQVLTKRRS